MIKIDTTVIIKNLKGEAFKDEDQNDLTLGKTISMCLSTSQQGGKMKSFLLAQKFYESDSVEVDIADFGIVKQAVETYQHSNNLVLGQALVLLDAAKDASEPKK